MRGLSSSDHLMLVIIILWFIDHDFKQLDILDYVILVLDLIWLGLLVRKLRLKCSSLK